MTATDVFAQITLDLDVLSDIPDAPEPKKKERKVRSAAPKQDKSAANKKNESARNAAAQKAEKKPQPSKKQPVKTTPPGRYQVKETNRPDEHDKLKPRANPVPVVKVLKSSATEPAPAQTASEPEMSKRFLEQQAQQENAAATEAVAVIETGSASVETAVPAPIATEQPVVVKTIVRRSVFPVDEKLGRKGRSLLLSREIPQDSATAKAIERGQLLFDIFLFEDRSSDLTDEMKLELIAIADEMRKKPKRRLLLLSYSGSTAPERGRERPLSLRRALTVRSALTRLGVKSLRIELRSHGLKGAGEKLPNRVDILFDD